VNATGDKEELLLLARAAASAKRAARQRLIDRILLTVLLLGIWQGVVAVGWIHPFFISQPTKVIADIWTMVSTGYIFRHFLITLWEALAGFVAGSVLGIGLGFAAALSPRLADALQPLIVAFDSMPRVAIAPLFIIWLGFGMSSKVMLAMLVVFFPIFFNTFSGMRAVDPVLVSSVRVMGGSKFMVLWLVNLPSTMAWVFAAMKTAISAALIGAVVGEFVGSTAGIGWIMVQAAGTNDTTRLFSTMAVLSLVGSALFIGVRWAEDRVLKWRPRTET